MVSWLCPAVSEDNFVTPTPTHDSVRQHWGSDARENREINLFYRFSFQNVLPSLTSKCRILSPLASRTERMTTREKKIIKSQKLSYEICSLLCCLPRLNSKKEQKSFQHSRAFTGAFRIFLRVRELSLEFSNVHSFNGFHTENENFHDRFCGTSGRHCTVYWKSSPTQANIPKLWMENPCKCHQQIPWIPLLVTTFRNFPLSFPYSTHDCSTEQSQIFSAPSNKERREKWSKNNLTLSPKVNFIGLRWVLERCRTW